ncbi:hypothetical protein SeLEV6574_g07120 [Synchytrium endobioticum]|uniref:Uncharacterized protein n=1 Tax=Synchytrium endobioticum TaxID=286115 RepID=A0A507CIX7_9FUNG|nr:hypothetical protein SeLEV6574_g07120 [Synchytrium endobioticum]
MSREGGSMVALWVQLFKRNAEYADNQLIPVQKLGDADRLCVPSDVTDIAALREHIINHDKFKDRLADVKPDQTLSTPDLQEQTKNEKTKQLQYKGMIVEASCMNYLDAVARGLSAQYNFDTTYRRATMDDVLAALDTNRWSLREKRDGTPVNPKPLDQLLTGDTWKKLREMNEFELRLQDHTSSCLPPVIPTFLGLEGGRLHDVKTTKMSVPDNEETNKRIHDGDIRKTSENKAYVIVPHSSYSADIVDMLKHVAAMSDVVFVPDDLVLKDEQELSGSSGSETSTPKDNHINYNTSNSYQMSLQT